ncbi:MAG: hypothetical protein WCS03_01300 [Bacteroidota bacterium]
MRKLPVIVLFFFIIPGLFTSVTTQKELNHILNFDSLWKIEHDTIGLINLIEADSFDLTILQPSSGVQFYKDGIVFLSMTKNEEKMLPDQISFGGLEAYFAIPEDSVLGKHLIFSPWSSFSYPCEAITFSPSFNTMYFTKLNKKKSREKIYKAIFTSNDKNQAGWLSEIIPLDFCTDNATYSHPTLSADEKMLIFASDRQGTLGGMDLFITRSDDNKWSSPENLGMLINTPGNEFFPFLDSDNNLFFSSDGLPGYGGYDIFTCKFNGENWDKPINLSHRINTANDDIAFTINKTDGKSAFYTRRQNTGKTEMQLFRVAINNKVADSNPLTISYIFNGKPEFKVVSTEEKMVANVKLVEVEPEKPAKPLVMVDTIKSVPEEKKVINDTIVYKVQILSSTAPKGKYQITVNNKLYDTEEYYYLREYRHTIGEFKSFSDAVKFQNDCRKSGYSVAFVVVFKNNIRSLDPKLFK